MQHQFRSVNVHIYPTPFEYESRILKVTKTLTANSIVEQVLIIAVARKGLPEQQVIDDKRQVIRIRTTFTGVRFFFKILRFIEWSTRVFVKLRHNTVDMVNCHSLSVLPLCVILKWWHKSTLIYEPHELETETITSKGVRRFIAKWVERRLIGEADHVIVVSNSIAKHYCHDYLLSQVSVILNVPETETVDTGIPNMILRNHFYIPDGHLVFMYQGVLDEARGVLWLLDAFKLVPEDRHLVFMGVGILAETIRSVAKVTPNIHFHPAVDPSEVLRYTRGADIGFVLLSDKCLSYQCALPNKLFQYIQAGLPVVVSDFDEMGSLVDHYQCGWRVANEAFSNNAKALASFVSAIDPEVVRSYRKGALHAKEELCWEREADKLAQIYRNLGITTLAN